MDSANNQQLKINGNPGGVSPTPSEGLELPKVAPSPVAGMSVTPQPVVIQSGAVTPVPVKRQKTEDGEDEDEEDDIGDTQGRTITEKGAEIDRASAGFVRLSAKEKAADTDEPDEFGYTQSKLNSSDLTLWLSSLFFLYII